MREWRRKGKRNNQKEIPAEIIAFPFQVGSLIIWEENPNN